MDASESSQALIAMTVGGVGAGFEAEGAGTVVGLGIAAVFLAVAGIVEGAQHDLSP